MVASTNMRLMDQKVVFTLSVHTVEASNENKGLQEEGHDKQHHHHHDRHDARAAKLLPNYVWNGPPKKKWKAKKMGPPQKILLDPLEKTCFMGKKITPKNVLDPLQKN